MNGEVRTRGVRRALVAVLLVVVALVGLAGCTTTQIKVTRDDRESAEQAADRVNRGKYVSDDNVYARHVPSCTTAPVDVDTCARDIAEARAEGNLGLGPREKVFSLPKTAGLVVGLLVTFVVIGGGVLVLRGKRPSWAGFAGQFPRPGGSGGPRAPKSGSPSQVQPPAPQQQSAPTLPRVQSNPQPPTSTSKPYRPSWQLPASQAPVQPPAQSTPPAATKPSATPPSVPPSPQPSTGSPSKKPYKPSY